jgi:hypothetical protein
MRQLQAQSLWYRVARGSSLAVQAFLCGLADATYGAGAASRYTRAAVSW